MNKHLKLLGLLSGCAVLGTVTAQAQDKATLDLLVKKNLISQAEADSIAKPAAAVTVTPKESLVKGLKLEGLIQIQYDWLSTDDKRTNSSNPPSENQFFVRRAILGAIADLGNGWGGEFLMDFAAGAQAPGAPQSGGGNAAQNNFEKMVIYKDVDTYGRMTVGYQKVNFMLEEYTSTTVVKPIERSLMSRYFDESYTALNNGRLGFANRHTGIYWDGKVAEVPGLTYGAAVTNGIQNSSGYSPVGGFNKFGGWGYLGYANMYDALNYSFGVNVGYSADGNSNPGPGKTPLTQSASNSVWGYNPYVRLIYNKSFQVDAEFAQVQMSNGRSNAAGQLSKAQPYGFTITPSYKINDQWEVVARLSYLNTNGRGVQVSQVVRDANNPVAFPAGSTPQFDSAYGAYIGLNWYIVGNDVKLSAGYEFNQFNNRGTTAGGSTSMAAGGAGSGRANVNGFRTRLQLLF